MNPPNLPPETPPRRHELDSGAVLLTRPMPSSFGVAVGVTLQSGTRDEPEELGGIHHLLEHMVFKGTATRGAFELARDLEAVGAHADAYTTKESTTYTLKVLPDQLDVALDILAEMLLGSTFPPDQLALEQQVVIEEILSSEDTPDDHVHELFLERLLGGHPLSRPILGTEASVRRIGRDRLDGFARKLHRGGNAIISAAGAVGPREEEQLAARFSFPSGASPRQPARLAPPRPGVFTFWKELSQQYVEIGVPTQGTDHPDRYAFSLLANVLGGGMSSRLFQKIREEAGLAYSIYSYADGFRDAGILGTAFSATPQNAQRALDLVAVEYERLRRGELDDEELEMNRAQLISTVILGLEGSMNQVGRLARSEMYFGRFLPVEEILDGLLAVRREDLVRIAEERLAPDLQTVVGHGPSENMYFGLV